MALYPPAHQEPLAQHSGPFSSIGLLMHVTAGYGDPGPWWRSQNNASAHFYVAKTGAITQYVDTANAAWAQAAGNALYHSVETEGYPTEDLTSEQISTLAGLYRWGHQVHGWPYLITDTPGGHGFGWHGMGGVAYGNHPGCPGDLRKAHRQQILTMASGGAPLPSGNDKGVFHAEPTIGNGYPNPGPAVSDFRDAINTVDVHRGLKGSTWDATYTHAAKDLQAFCKLKVDGVVGDQTWAMLAKVLVAGHHWFVPRVK